MIITKDFTGWQYYTNENKDGTKTNVGIKYEYPNGFTHTISLADPDVVAWLAANNTPLPAST